MTYIAHGTDPNEIGHGVDIDLNDTPGSSGGKFIGFGEPGTSAKANRAHWFLSQNIDHVYQEVHRDIAISKRYDRTSPGGGESYFQFPAGADIWVGDDTYPGSVGVSDPEGMQMLFNVVDANYNELTDTFDNEIRVKRVRETTGTTDIYQGGFEAEPRIYFVAVDPATGVEVTEPYTIPAGTNYKVLCGVKSTVAEMPADALIRLKVQASSEVEAGTFLQDGSRAMTGDLDIGGNDVVGFTGLSGLVTSSLQDVLNADIDAQELLVGNRTVDQTGSVSPSNAIVTYPDLTVMLQGQVVTIAGSTVTAPDATNTYYLCVTAAGAVVLLADDANWGDYEYTNPVAGSVLIWKGDYTSTGVGIGTWANPVDLRWPSTRRGNHMSVYVGDGVGADFTSLNEAIIWITEATSVGSSKMSITYEIVIVGSVEVSSTITLPNGWILRGLGTQGADRSWIYTTTTFPVDSHVIVAGRNNVITNLEIRWHNASAGQNANRAALSIDAGDLVENVSFGSGANVFGMNIYVADAAWASTADTIVRNCLFSKFSTAGISAEGKARVRVEHSKFIGGTPDYHIYFPASGTAGDDTGPGHTIKECHFDGTPTAANIYVDGPNVLIDSCHGELSGAAVPFIKIGGAVASQTRAGVTVRNCLVEDGFTFIYCHINKTTLVLSALVEGCSISGFTDRVFDFGCTNVAAGSGVDIKECSITGHAAGYVGYFTYVNTTFVRNKVLSAGTGLYVNSADVKFENNYITSTGTGQIITYNSGTGVIRNNYLYYNGATAGTIGILIDAYAVGVTIEGNYLNGNNANAAVAIKLRSPYNRVAGNRFYLWKQYCVYIDSSSEIGSYQWIADNYFEAGCTSTITVDGYTDVAASAIFVDGAEAVDDLSISRNIFDSVVGSAIRISEAGSRKATSITGNVFDSVQGTYLYDGGGDTIQMDRCAVIYIGDIEAASAVVGSWHISDNKFHNCGRAYTDSTPTLIATSAIYLNTLSLAMVSSNDFRDSVGSHGVGSVLDFWFDLYIQSDGDVICNNCSFYRNVEGGTDNPNLFVQVSQIGAGSLTLSGCSFILVGDIGAGYAGSGCGCVSSTDGTIYATGCRTVGTWDNTAGDLWSIATTTGCIIGCSFVGNHVTSIVMPGGMVIGCIFNGAVANVITLEYGIAVGCRFAASGSQDLSGADGNVIGCVFHGAASALIDKTNGFTIGNVVRGIGTLSISSHPVPTTYSALSASSPMLEFNKKI